MIEILHKYTKAVIYKSETAETVAQAVCEAVKANVSLSGSDLRDSNLSYSDLRGSDLRGSNLSGSDLRGSDLRGSNLSGSDMRGSDLSYSDLSGSNLSYSDLSYSDLSGSNLSGSNLSYSDLRGSNLSGSDMRGSDLRGSKEIPVIAAAHTIIAPEGSLIGWKKCHDGVIVKLRIPEDARRSNATGRKCRAEFVDVIEVIGSDVGISQHDGTTKYIAGTRVRCDQWCEDRWQECAGGIHFFITREEAEDY